MKNDATTVGQRIRSAREKEGMSQSELAKALGYSSPTAISLIEAGERNVKVEILVNVAKILHQDVDYLMTGGASTVPKFRTALRADKSFNATDVKQIENYIDFLMSQKKKNGRGES